MHTMQSCIPRRLRLHAPPIPISSSSRYEIMLLCWKDDPDERPHFETLSNVLRSILSDTSDSDMLSSSVGDSYVDMSSSVFCFSENPDSNASMAQTVFPNHLSSLSDYRNNGRENYRQQEVYGLMIKQIIRAEHSTNCTFRPMGLPR